MAKKKSKETIERDKDETPVVPSPKAGLKHHATKLKNKASFHFSNLISTKKGRVIAIIAGVVVVLAILYAVPFTRYFALGPFIKKDVSITVVDSITKQPVSNATVAIGGSSAQSDKNGVAKLKAVSAGQAGIKVTKQYYQNTNRSYTVPVVFNPESPTVELVANGRQVAVTVTNKVSGDPLEDVTVSSNDTKATTNSEGKATIILPANGDSWQATLSKDSYNSLDVKLVNDTGNANSYSITPSGSIYYLSKATGKINVMKSNLDGTNATVAFEGTGEESDYGTSLLSARDWRYSALLATREADAQKIFLIDSVKNDVSVIDEGDASFTFVGWSGHNFVYLVTRKTDNLWDDKRQALKSFNADTRKLTTLDETTGSGTSSFSYAGQYFSSLYIVGNEVAYLRNWYLSYGGGGDKRAALLAANVTTGEAKVVSDLGPSANMRLYEPVGLYIRSVPARAFNPTFYEYEDGALKTVDINDTKFSSSYPTYLISPSGDKTLWYEQRDGKNTLLLGDHEGANAKVVGNLSDFTPYGWYGADDQYILLTKNGSELYIASANKVIDSGYTPLKITDYHRAQSYIGYGSGYGGQ